MKKNLRIYLFEDDLDFGFDGGDLDFGSGGGDLDFGSGGQKEQPKKETSNRPKGPSAAQLLQTKLKELDASAPQTGKMDQATINLVMKLLNPKVEEVKKDDAAQVPPQNQGGPLTF